jgi:RNA polymerase sigma-70 factor (ECF subfamily)
MPKPAFQTLRSIFDVSDEQAMWRVQQEEDEASFALLVRRWLGPIQRLCKRMTGDAQHAEDLAQDAFVRVFMRRKEYQASGKFSTWLWRIALNLCYDELRRRQRREKTIFSEEGGERLGMIEAFAAEEAAPDRSLAERERSGMVQRALDELPEIYRAVLVLRHYEDLKFREIAEVLGVPEGTVKSRMAEALKQFGRLLEPKVGGKREADPAGENHLKESLML